MTEPMIDLRQVSVHLPIYNARGRDFKAMLLKKISGRIEVEADQAVTVVRALTDVSLKLRPGDRLALVGRNGAGKTSLLRVMARIYPPTAGEARIIGRVSALTDLALGMDLEASGYENIVLRTILMGHPHRAARRITEDVAEFTELGDFLHLPVRTYSSGMMLRLAFALSTAFQPEILILDEAIGAGDANFQEKAQKRLNEFVSKASIMVLASHDDNILKNMCRSAVWMKDGRVAAEGPVDDILRQYHAA